MHLRTLPKPIILLALLGACLPNLWAQPNPAITKSAMEKIAPLRIPHLDREPKLEDFADMKPPSEVTSTMLKIDQFWQHDPNDGVAVSQKTEAYLGYTDNCGSWINATPGCYHDNAGSVIATFHLQNVR